MLLERCTEEFQKIYNRYNRYIRESKKTTFNIEKLLEERSRQMINRQDEEDLLYEEALTGMGSFEAGFDDKSIHNRVKFQRLEGRKKKMLKKSLINVIDSVQISGFPSDRNISTPMSQSVNNYSLSPNIFTPHKDFLPPINGIFAIDLKRFNSSKNYENLAKINKIVENNPIIKKNISKAFLEKVLLPKQKTFQTQSTYMNTDNSVALNQDSGSSFDNSQSIPYIETKIQEEYYKRIQQMAGKKETDQLLKVIDKHHKLKSYMDKIEHLEQKINLSRNKSLKVMDHYENKRTQLQSKYKRVYEKNFVGF
jgi:hypothetical protein